MNKLKCKKCGAEIKEIRANVFNYDGSDSFRTFSVKQVPYNAVVFETDINWTGYELTDEERKDTIECPYCHKYPFDDKTEIQTYEILRVVCFKK